MSLEESVKTSSLKTLKITGLVNAKKIIQEKQFGVITRPFTSGFRILGFPIHGRSIAITDISTLKQWYSIGCSLGLYFEAKNLSRESYLQSSVTHPSAPFDSA